MCGNGVMRCTIDADALRGGAACRLEDGVMRGVARRVPIAASPSRSVRIDEDDEGKEVQGEQSCVADLGPISINSPGLLGVEDVTWRFHRRSKWILADGRRGFFRGGELHVCGRKDLIILRVQNLTPQDLERCAGAGGTSTQTGLRRRLLRR